ncbi:MAG: nuclear transport factor 2 family protein [Candidatus Krumholzibacteriota bacterium]|nr:nuclear transport factor 2 family protein [Candidatus Krumholzibacteriota bacterium]
MNRKIWGGILATLIIIILAAPGRALPGGEEEAAVKKVIEEAYVRGVHIDRDVPAMRSGFHPEFNMLILKDDNIVTYPIDKWVESVEKSKKDHPQPPAHKITYKFPWVDVTGNAAVAKIEIYRDDRHIYTDYMSLYKFPEGWKIVNKIYHGHMKK